MGELTFRITGRVGVLATTTASTGLVETRQALCRTCEYFQVATERCLRPCGVCPGGEARVKPWLKWECCPDGRWKRNAK